jgi:hypothetical protein
MMKRWMVLICFLCLAGAGSLAQTQQAAPPDQPPANTTSGNGEAPDAPVAQSAKAAKACQNQRGVRDEYGLGDSESRPL